MARFLSFTCLALVTAVVCASAQMVPWQVLGSGGTLQAGGTNRILSATVGQPAIGVRLVTDGSALSQGFWLRLDATVGVSEELNRASMSLSNYPNPFSVSTIINVHAPIDGSVTLRVYSLVGERVRTISADLQPTGSRSIAFNGCTDSGEPLTDGHYYYEFVSDGPNGCQSRYMGRMTVLR